MFEGLLQPTHLIIIMAIALLVFGPSKLGDIGGELGRGIRDFKKAIADIEDAGKVSEPVAGSSKTEPAGAPPSTSTPA